MIKRVRSGAYRINANATNTIHGVQIAQANDIHCHCSWSSQILSLSMHYLEKNSVDSAQF